MKSRITLVAALGAACITPAFSQWDFTLDGRDVQIHSFASQGFAYSDNNNYLSMHTSDGSFSMTDMGININSQITNNFHVGAQLYDRNVGHLGNWRPDADWYVADYKVKSWFGIRGGKVKTALGLYNDTQDLNFLYTWALFPQSVYPVDSRGDNIAHVGGDIYGSIGTEKLGSMSYTLYGGQRLNDPGSGLVYGNETSGAVTINGASVFVLGNGKNIKSFSGPVYGADLRWTTPVNGLVMGTSYEDLNISGSGTYIKNGAPYINHTAIDEIYAFYTAYTLGNFNFAGE